MSATTEHRLASTLQGVDAIFELLDAITQRLDVGTSKVGAAGGTGSPAAPEAEFTEALARTRDNLRRIQADIATLNRHLSGGAA